MKIALRPLCHLLLGLGYLPSAFAQGTAFTYQGQLADGAAPAAGIYELRFAIYDAATGGNQRASAVTNAATAVSNGFFTVTLDFGFGVFNGGARWLELGVRSNGAASAFATLSPRQAVTPAPYAFWAANASQAVTVSGTVPASGLNGLYSNPVSFNNPANGFAGDGSGLANVNAAQLGGRTAAQFWQTGGNTGANPTNSAFLGTADNQALEFKVNNQRVLRLEPNLNTPNLVGGSLANVVTNGIYGAVIAGGGSPAYPNRVGATYASVLGGAGNTASGSFAAALGNFTTASGYAGVALGYSTLAGGYSSFAGGNSAKANHDGAFVWADHNFADFTSTANNQFLIRAGGGVGINTNNPHGAALAVNGNLTVSGSFSLPNGNLVRSVNGMRDDVYLGAGNGLAFSGNQFSLATSGITVTNLADGFYALKGVTPPGSFINKVGLWGLAGEPANAWLSTTVGVHGESSDGVGVFGVSRSTEPYFGGVRGWGIGNTTGVYGSSDSGRGIYGSTGGSGSAIYGENNSASGYAGDFSGNARITGQLKFGSQTRQMIDLWGGVYGIGVQSGTHYFRTGTGPGDRFAWYQGGTHSDTALDPGTGGTFLMSLDRSYLTVRGNGNEQPYIGGDGFGGDIEIGSRNAGIMTVGFWNGAAGSHMDVVARSFNPTSDRHAKQDFAAVNPAEILEKVVSLPVSKWAFKSDAATRHIGPMAQDFKAAFGTGIDDKHIATVDADGVALAAIQGLNQKLEAEAKSKDAHIAELEQRLAAIEALLKK